MEDETPKMRRHIYEPNEIIGVEQQAYFNVVISFTSVTQCRRYCRIVIIVVLIP